MIFKALKQQNNKLCISQKIPKIGEHFLFSANNKRKKNLVFFIVTVKLVKLQLYGSQAFFN